jgi:hypothetical protein
MHILKTRHNCLHSPGGVFYDLGCGIGKPVFAAGLIHKFDKLVGVEILEDLYKVCVETMHVWTKDVKPILGEEVRYYVYVFYYIFILSDF